MNESPFHSGELAVQSRAGVRERVGELGGRMIRDRITAPQRELLAGLRMLLVASIDDRGRPWASMLFGSPGFVGGEERRLRIDAGPPSDDPLHANLALGAPIGALGIEPQTRRRHRVNGSVVELDARGFAVRVDESFGNCPQYIRPRAALSKIFPTDGGVEASGPALDARLRLLIESSDTLFIASAAAPRGPADISHRAGAPGFVRVEPGAGTGSALELADYRGNNLFNTLGNVAMHAQAGLLFIDWAAGDLLQLACDAQIVWDGAERRLRLGVREGRYRRAASPLRWISPSPSPG